MIYEVSRDAFVVNALSSFCVWTDILRDSMNFNCKYYCDDSNIYYLSINYGEGETIVVFSAYSYDIINKVRKIFLNALDFCFACSIEDYNLNNTNELDQVTYHYKLVGKPQYDYNRNIIIQKADETKVDDLKKYDNFYMNFLAPNHGARLENFWNNNKENIKNEDAALYLAYIDDIPIGFSIVNFYRNLSACDISQLSIEKPFQRKGLGTQFLKRVTCELCKKQQDIYYSSVSGDNIASQKTCERVGFKKIACRVSV